MCRASGRSLAQEIEFRLERSFREQDIVEAVRTEVAQGVHAAVEQLLRKEEEELGKMMKKLEATEKKYEATEKGARGPREPEGKPE